MRHLILLFCIFILVASCSGIKFKPHYADVDYIERNGNVKYIEYIWFFSKSPTDTSRIGIEYNDKNLPIKQIDYGKGKRGDQIAYFHYDKSSRLIEQIPDNPNAPWHYKLTYDSKGNLINHKSFTNDILKHEKRYFYDKNKNLIKEQGFRKGDLHEEALYTNDYKNRVSITIFYIQGVKSKKIYKRYFDRKGNLVRTEFVRDNNSISSQNKISYDKFGNVAKIQFTCSTTENIHTYDDKNNLVKTLVYFNGELYKTEIYNIEYQ